MQQLENELAQTQTNLDQATTNLEEKEKALQNVSYSDFVLIFRDINPNNEPSTSISGAQLLLCVCY